MTDVSILLPLAIGFKRLAIEHVGFLVRGLSNLAAKKGSFSIVTIVEFPISG